MSKILVEAGIPADLIAVSSRGEREPAIATPDGVAGTAQPAGRNQRPLIIAAQARSSAGRAKWSSAVGRPFSNRRTSSRIPSTVALGSARFREAGYRCQEPQTAVKAFSVLGLGHAVRKEADEVARFKLPPGGDKGIIAAGADRRARVAPQVEAKQFPVRASVWGHRDRRRRRRFLRCRDRDGNEGGHEEHFRIVAESSTSAW